MSNPAVITLSKVNTKVGTFVVEDNLGESIHLHVGEIRCDLTTQELKELAQSAKIALEKFIKADNFEVDKFSSEFLLQMAESEMLHKIQYVKDDVIQLRDLNVDTCNKFGYEKETPLVHSRVLKALNGDSAENNARDERNYFGQTNQQRVNDILSLVREKGYPYEGKKIVLVEGSNRIYDGQHRAACIFYLFGNKEIPILRLGFSDKRIGQFHPMRGKLFHWNLNRIRKYILSMYRIKVKVANSIKFRLNTMKCNWDRYKYKNVK